MSTHVSEMSPVHVPRKHSLVLLSEEPLAPLEVRVLHRRWRVAPGLSDLPVHAVTTLADGGSCRPRALWVGDREISLSETADGLLVAQGPRVLVGDVGTEVGLSLEVRNEGHSQSNFRGAILLGDWGTLATDLGTAYCQEGGACRVPASGGACPGCNYPRAYAHPSSLLDAFLVDQVYVEGTAVQVYPDPGVTPGLVQVVQRDGRLDEYPIPPAPEEDHSPSEVVDRCLLRASPRQLRAGLDSPAESLGLRAQARLLWHSATLMSDAAAGRDLHKGGLGSAPRDLALALADGVVALSRGYGGHLRSCRALELLAGEVSAVSRRQMMADLPLASEVRTILSELGHRGRADRVRSMRAETWVVVDDRRSPPHPWAERATTGRFLGAVSRIRVALLPGEADHVRIYDLRIVDPGGDAGCSVLDRVPEYGPGLVREGPPVQVDAEARATRYLPGAVLAGRLRDGVSLDYPYLLSPSDLSGGVLIDLGRSLPPLSQVCLVYQVEPGHLFCAAVEPA